jgi:hypothetical protein
MRRSISEIPNRTRAGNSVYNINYCVLNSFFSISFCTCRRKRSELIISHQIYPDLIQGVIIKNINRYGWSGNYIPADTAYRFGFIRFRVKNKIFIIMTIFSFVICHIPCGYRYTQIYTFSGCKSAGKIITSVVSSADQQVFCNQPFRIKSVAAGLSACVNIIFTS